MVFPLGEGRRAGDRIDATQEQVRGRGIAGERIAGDQFVNWSHEFAVVVFLLTPRLEQGGEGFGMDLIQAIEHQ